MQPFGILIKWDLGFQDKMQHIFLEKNVIFMDFLLLKMQLELTSFESFLFFETKKPHLYYLE